MPVALPSKLPISGRRIEIDARARRTYFACRSLPRSLAFQQVATTQLQSMLATRKLALLPFEKSDRVVFSVGGFEVLELFTALSLRGRQPTSVDIEIVEPTQQAINSTPGPQKFGVPLSFLQYLGGISTR